MCWEELLSAKSGVQARWGCLPTPLLCCCAGRQRRDADAGSAAGGLGRRPAPAGHHAAVRSGRWGSSGRSAGLCPGPATHGECRARCARHVRHAQGAPHCYALCVHSMQPFPRLAAQKLWAVGVILPSALLCLCPACYLRQVWMLAAASALLGCYRGIYSAALEAIWADSIATGRRWACGGAHCNAGLDSAQGAAAHLVGWPQAAQRLSLLICSDRPTPLA